MRTAKINVHLLLRLTVKLLSKRRANCFADKVESRRSWQGSKRQKSELIEKLLLTWQLHLPGDSLTVYDPPPPLPTQLSASLFSQLAAAAAAG